MNVGWDAAKFEANRQKHGVTFEEAASVFFDPFAHTDHADHHGTACDVHRGEAR